MIPESPNVIDLHSTRAQKARLGKAIGKNGYRLLVAVSLIALAIAALALYARVAHLPALMVAVSLASFMIAVWWKNELNELPVDLDGGLTGRLSRDALALLPKDGELTPTRIWTSYGSHWQTRFILNHAFVPGGILNQVLQDTSDTSAVWSEAANLAQANSSNFIEVGHVIGALMHTSPEFMQLATQAKLRTDDIRAVVAWLDRSLETLNNKSDDYGGIGRDWANGYTPQLDQFGYNISLSIEHSGSIFSWLAHSHSINAVKNAFSQGTSAVALIGGPGSGKTSHVYALAQRLLAEKHDRALEHRQIISLSASAIVSSATHPGELEYIVSNLLGEAIHAGHIILFFDDAELFFSQGTGAFDASKLLLQVLQSRAVQIIFAFTPHDWQVLKGMSPSLTSLITPVVLPEPEEDSVMRVLEDTAIGMEGRHHVLITYDALREAYRLSGRYDTETAYPGKAINLLDQALTQAEDGVITATSVQHAIEQSRGVKVIAASSVESDVLLHLEDEIHKRMVNQTRAVSVVSNALRRARAGVANTRRPIGSFLFLGPTGVGKTELAKAISAVYFNSEASMTRLDMSEYQRADDVSRLLSDGANEAGSLIMHVRQQPFGVVLLDEIEKAHPNVLNLLLQMLDEGQLTDNGGRTASFKDCVIICTSNAGADTIRECIAAGESLESFEDSFTDQLITSGQFKPELLNRFDEIVLFRPLDQTELLQIVKLMLNGVNTTLANQNISVELTQDAAMKIVEAGYDPRLGARPMRRVLQRAVEDVVAGKILRGDIHPGDRVTLDISDLAI